MLNKAICKKCNQANSDWSAIDNESWERSKMIYCFVKKIDVYSIKEVPPSNCLHLFEHAVSGAMKNA
jgi:hypothetical protein